MAPGRILQVFLRVAIQNQIRVAQRVIVDEIVQFRPLCAAALFVWLRARYERRPVPAAPLWARLSPLVFGVYWAHPLILAGTARLTGTDWTPGQCLLLQLPATLLLSLLAAWLLSRTPVLRRILM